MKIYDYVLIQYVGDPVRQEAVNVGVAALGAADGDACVTFDRGAAARIRRSWPQFDGALYRAFVRDLSASLGVPHQARFGEQQSPVSATVESLRALSAAASNQFELTDPARWTAESIDEAARQIYARLVRERPRVREKPRHMRRSELRDMVSSILRRWAQTRAEDVAIEADLDVAGQLAHHPVDLVASRAGHPEHLFFVVPIGDKGPRARQARLIRDALPAAVADIRNVQQNAHFYAVMPEAHPEESARLVRFLSQVEGLDVLTVDAVEKRFQNTEAIV